MLIYCDLDETLVAPVRGGRVAPGFNNVIPRPGAEAFLGSLSRHGDIVLLTMSTRNQAEHALRILGRPARFIGELISREDLELIGEQIDVVERADVSPREKAALYRDIRPLYPQGFIFDDQPIGSGAYEIKSLATATPPERWIQVASFGYPGLIDRGGLQRAYREFLRRNAAGVAGATLKGRRAYA